MVSCLHNGNFQFFAPNLGGPITNGHEVLLVHGVSPAGVDGTVVLALLVSESPLDFRFFVSVLAVDGVSLFGAHNELMRVGFGIILQASSTVNFAIGLVGISEDKLVGGLFERAHIPPKHAAISGG